MIRHTKIGLLISLVIVVLAARGENRSQPHSEYVYVEKQTALIKGLLAELGPVEIVVGT